MASLAEMLALAESATQGVEVSDGNFSPIDPGTYPVAVTAAEGPKPSKRANPDNPSEFGQYIKIEFTITEGKYAGRKLWANNNIVVYPKSKSADDCHNAQVAMKIGSNERKVLLDSIGRNGIEAAAELVGATCKVQVALGKNDKGEIKNEIKKLIPIAISSSAHGGVVKSPSAPSAAVQSKPKMPWEK